MQVYNYGHEMKHELDVSDSCLILLQLLFSELDSK